MSLLTGSARSNRTPSHKSRFLPPLSQRLSPSHLSSIFKSRHHVQPLGQAHCALPRGYHCAGPHHVRMIADGLTDCYSC